MSRLSRRQREALVVLSTGEATPGRLAEQLGTSREGASMTASSLVRHGHAIRFLYRGRTIYKITPQGLAQVRFEQTAFGP